MIRVTAYLPFLRSIVFLGITAMLVVTRQTGQ